MAEPPAVFRLHSEAVSPQLPVNAEADFNFIFTPLLGDRISVSKSMGPRAVSVSKVF